MRNGFYVSVRAVLFIWHETFLCLLFIYLIFWAQVTGLTWVGLSLKKKKKDVMYFHCTNQDVAMFESESQSDDGFFLFTIN